MSFGLTLVVYNASLFNQIQITKIEKKKKKTVATYFPAVSRHQSKAPARLGDSYVSASDQPGSGRDRARIGWRPELRRFPSTSDEEGDTSSQCRRRLRRRIGCRTDGSWRSGRGIRAAFIG